jgi:threonine/homoserine/homoserine lactone efflux protein
MGPQGFISLTIFLGSPAKEMKIFLVFPLAYVMGFFEAIPIGATQIEIAKRSLNGQFGPALMVVCGSVCSDVLYGIVAFFGIAPFLKHEIIMAIFWLVGTLILWILAFFTLRQNAKSPILPVNRTILKSRRFSFVTGFSLALTNPIMILWWLIGAQIVRDLKLVQAFTPAISISFLCFGGLGIASYLTTLATVLHWAKKFLSDKLMRRINFLMGIVLIMLSIYFLIRSLKIWLS